MSMAIMLLSIFTAAKDAPKAAAGSTKLQSKQKVGFVQGIDGTIATIAPGGSKVTVPYNTVLEIQVSPTQISHALTFNLEKDGSVGVILLDNIALVRSGQDCYGTDQLLQIPVGFNMLGKVMNPLGHEIPTGLFTKSSPLFAETKEGYGLIEEQSPNIVSRSPVNYNMLTGFKVCPCQPRCC